MALYIGYHSGKKPKQSNEYTSIFDNVKLFIEDKIDELRNKAFLNKEDNKPKLSYFD